MPARKTNGHHLSIPVYIAYLLILAIVITCITIWINHSEPGDGNEINLQSMLIQDEMSFNLVAIGLILFVITITGFGSGDGYLSKPSKKASLYSLKELKKTQLRYDASRSSRTQRGNTKGPGQSAA